MAKRVTTKTGKGVKKTLNIQVAARLRALKEERGARNNKEFGSWAGESENSANNWLIADNCPGNEAAIKLCETTGITLDWLFRGSPAGMNSKRAARLDRLSAVKLDDISQ